MYFDSIILYSTKKIGQSRTSSAIYHLLNGRKSIQTLQDAKIFELESFYSIYPNLSKVVFQQKLTKLVKNGYLTIVNNDNVFDITDAGEKWLQTQQSHFCFQALNGIKYAKTADIFFKRLLLFIQTIINSNEEFFSFIPINDEKEITAWVKIFYKKVRPYQKKVKKNLFKELKLLLKTIPEELSNMFVDRLSGYKNYGLSTQQLAAKYQLSVDDINILFVGMTHHILSELEREKFKYNLLSLFVELPSERLPISLSANKTNQLLRKGSSLDEIAKLRKLRINTVEDHIVEISLYDPYFPFESYVSEEEQIIITDAIQRTKSYKLKDIKEKVNEQISYFQIRLILTKLTK
ncbi:helix-turn-helix domain-containing protein [Cerasibacillus terrae]|nr:helix-turn-helix domain-containing protein [Cerasibacillus terrae]